MKKVLRVVDDILFIAIVFMITDWLMLHAFHTEKILPEVLVYIAVYGLLSGLKWLIQSVQRKRQTP